MLSLHINAAAENDVVRMDPVIVDDRHRSWLSNGGRAWLTVVAKVQQEFGVLCQGTKRSSDPELLLRVPVFDPMEGVVVMIGNDTPSALNRWIIAVRASKRVVTTTLVEEGFA